MNSLIADRVAKGEQADQERESALTNFVREAAKVSADFEVQVTTAGQLAALLAAIGGHNNYDPRRTAELLGPLVGDAMQVRVHEFSGGPAIYVQVPFFAHQKLTHRHDGGGMGERLSDEERRAYAQDVVDVAKTLRADEISVQQHPHVSQEKSVLWRGQVGDGPYEIRLWWD